jgi:hypothetical protein
MLPRLSAHFDGLGLGPQLYLVEWVFTLFGKALPQQPLAWIWDRVLLLGDIAVFSAALGVSTPIALLLN